MTACDVVASKLQGSLQPITPYMIPAHCPLDSPPPAQRREHAEKAMKMLDGQVLHDHELKLGWGKSITVPAMAMPSSAAGRAVGACTVGCMNR